jgi:hypothetical protein
VQLVMISGNELKFERLRILLLPFRNSEKRGSTVARTPLVVRA